MKKILLMIVPLMALIGCSYDDTDIQKRLDDLDGQLTELQALVKALNSDVTTLKELVAGKRFISDVQPGEDGGYVITLVTAAGETSTITISDGKDGTSSVIGVKQDSDGVYYWTLNGDFILDNGKKLPVSGVTPEFKIENSHWWVSYDNGATWTDCGQAQTDQNLFKSVATSEDGKLVYLTLADGTVLTFELYVQFGIAFDTASATIRVGETAEIPFTLTGADAKTDIQALADGAWKAEVKRTGNEGGTIAVTAPGDSSTGKVIVLVSDGDAKTLMRTLTFVSGVLNVSTSSKEATAAGGPVTVEVETDLDYTVAIPEAAKAWITLAETRGGEIRTETLTFNVAANTETQSRSANIELVAGETVIETILIYQEAWVILLALTSNKGSHDFQLTEDANGERLFEKVLKKSQDWATDEQMMYVVGATQGRAFEDIRKIVPNHFLLVPGVGAQGGSLEEVCKYGMNSTCGLIVNSSRGIIYVDKTEKFAEAARTAAQEVQAQMAEQLKAIL